MWFKSFFPVRGFRFESSVRLTSIVESGGSFSILALLNLAWNRMNFKFFTVFFSVLFQTNCFSLKVLPSRIEESESKVDVGSVSFS